jgi:hypothetical protein
MIPRREVRQGRLSVTVILSTNQKERKLTMKYLVMFLMAFGMLAALTIYAGAQGPFTKEELSDKEQNAKWNKDGIRTKELMIHPH